MCAKLKSKTHLLNTFFDFLSHFLRVKVFKKCILAQIFYFDFNKKWLKIEFFTLIFNPLKKLLKMHQKIVMRKTSLTNMSKSEKSAYFCHIFTNNFFCIFQHFFTQFEFLNKNLFCSF